MKETNHCVWGQGASLPSHGTRRAGRQPGEAPDAAESRNELFLKPLDRLLHNKQQSFLQPITPLCFGIILYPADFLGRIKQDQRHPLHG